MNLSPPLQPELLGRLRLGDAERERRLPTGKATLFAYDITATDDTGIQVLEGDGRAP